MTFANLVVLVIDQDEFLVVVIVCCAVLNVFPEDISGEVRVHDPVEDGVSSSEAIARSAVGIPCCA